ncbi:MAG: hypothetical protein WCY97_03865 [Methanothrix sp.]|jgi:hypothetical protein|uniref:Lipoprotein n=1 Tax=Methanothrix harundinacea TaxID=301375 RepID=A0A117LEW0_9EURY|nr:MAG: hypothetical protein APR56_03230 [Methanosaeta sp. SDB]KUK43358.1 MAG: Uncharacterized protein XD72_2277 [Methanothrix harundinacea]MDD2638329.1 hypothetical protein [Methanothrix sp.]MDI9399450.1 hypothetical protein [Euryarchaeota archaeon]KUK96875.1 MAG: Uncharacterized protein XE07_0826 [Methanothrix harundinacea]
MKTIWFFGLLAFVLAATASAAEIPSLVGSWAGAGPGYNAAAGYIDEGVYCNLTFNVTEQNGRLFNGEMTYQLDGVDIVEGFAGAIASDGETFYVAEFISGYDVGTIISEDEIEVIYFQEGEAGEIFVKTLRRVAE